MLNFFPDKIFFHAWRTLLRVIKPMAFWTILVWGVLTLILIPLTSALVSWGLLRGDRLVVSNEELLQWALSPIGISYILVAGGVTLVASIVRFAGLFQIVTADLQHKKPSIAGMIRTIFPAIPRLFKLSVFTIFAAFVLLLIFSGGAGLAYLAFLQEHDINYYLATTPPEWYNFIIATGTWGVLWLIGTLYILGRSFLAIPAYINSDLSLIRSIKASWKVLGSKTVRFLRSLGVIAALWISGLMLMEFLLLWSVTEAIGWISENTSRVRPITFLAGFYFLGSQLMRVTIGFFGFSLVATLVTKFYYEDTSLHRQPPPAPGLMELSSSVGNYISRWVQPVRLLLLFAIFAVGSLVTSAYLLSDIPSGENVTISAHRGGPPSTPENTLASVEQSIQDGADFTEIDVQRTTDGIVVLLHDVDLMRVANDPRRIADVRYDEIRDLVQVPDDGTPAEMRRIVSLEDFLEYSKGKITPMIELKYYGSDPDLVKAVLNVIREKEMESEVVVMSMRLQPIVELRNLEPSIKRGFVSSVAVGDLSRLPVDFLAVNQTQITSALVRSAHAQGIEIYPWTVNNPDDMVRMVNLGVDGLITDFPAMAGKIRDELQEMTIAERLILNLTGWIIDEFTDEDSREEDLLFDNGEVEVLQE